MSPTSNTLWKYINSIGTMLVVFGRLSLAISLFTSIIAGYFVISFIKTEKGKIFVYILLIVTIGSTILNWGHRRVIPEINDNVLRKNVWSSTLTEGTTAYFLNTKWADIDNLWFSKKPKAALEIIKGEGIIKLVNRTSVEHTYIVYARTPLVLKENTIYFPGWSLKSNYKQIPIYPGERGLINAKLPQGLQRLEFTYEDLLPYKIAKIISFLSLSVLIILLIYSYLPGIKRFNITS